jgi:hypothetical protein
MILRRKRPGLGGPKVGVGFAGELPVGEAKFTKLTHNASLSPYYCFGKVLASISEETLIAFGIGKHAVAALEGNYGRANPGKNLQ